MLPVRLLIGEKKKKELDHYVGKIANSLSTISLSHYMLVISIRSELQLVTDHRSKKSSNFDF